MYKVIYDYFKDGKKFYDGKLLFDDFSTLKDFLFRQISCHGSCFSDETIVYLLVVDLDTLKPALSLQFY